MVDSLRAFSPPDHADPQHDRQPVQRVGAQTAFAREGNRPTPTLATIPEII